MLPMCNRALPSMFTVRCIAGRWWIVAPSIISTNEPRAAAPWMGGCRYSKTRMDDQEERKRIINEARSMVMRRSTNGAGSRAMRPSSNGLNYVRIRVRSRV
jgi:hypothetical protein